MSGEFDFGHLEQDSYGGQSVEYKSFYPSTHGLARPGAQRAAQSVKNFYFTHKAAIHCGAAGFLGGIALGVLLTFTNKGTKLRDIYSDNNFANTPNLTNTPMSYRHNTPMSYRHNYF